MVEIPLYNQIEQPFGVLPNFFRLASDTPEVTANLWGFAQFAYLDSPLPSLFKERLFVYLSRFCQVRYCIARHIGFLVGLGYPAGDRNCQPQTIEQVLPLLQCSLPRGRELETAIALCTTNNSSGFEFPSPDTALESAIFACATHIFLQTPHAPRAIAALRTGLGATRMELLNVFLAFVRMAHYWAQTHPELRFEEDINQLLATHEVLANCLLNDPEVEDNTLNQQVLKEQHELVQGYEMISRENEQLPIERQERQRVEENRRQSETRLQLALDALEMGTFGWYLSDDRKRVEERQAFLLKLSDALRPLTDASEIQAVAARILGESMRATRVIYIEVVSEGEEVIVHCNYTNGVAQLSGRYHLEDYRRNLTADHQVGRTQVITDIPNNPKYTDAEKAKYRDLDIAAHIDVPLIKNNQFVALLAVHQSTPRQWTEIDVNLVEETAERTWAAVERARAEKVLAESEEKYRTLFESIDEGFCVIEMLFDENSKLFDYRFLESNPAFEKQTGLTDVKGKQMRELAPNHEEYWFEIYGNVALTGEPNRFENYATALHRWYNVYAFPIGYPDDRKIAVLFTDISDRKEAEAEREQLLAREQAAREVAENANRIKDEFLAVLSHELRTPLNPILGWLSLIRQGRLDAEKTAYGLEVIERNAKLLVQLIEDLLDVSRILQGKLNLNRVPVNLAPVIRSALETVLLAVEAKSIQIQTVLDGEVGQVLGDSVRLQQIIWNLLTNAVKFTPKGGQVKIRLRAIGTQAQIQVRDTGKGIQPDFLSHVFEYFRQADSATTRKFGGLGLGLAIVRHLIELHGGTVQVESPGEGQGATFTVRLPLIETAQLIQDKTLVDDSMVRSAELPLAGIRVLVVDDDPDSRNFCQFLLERLGATVMAAASGNEALQALALTKPDILLSDIGMPEMDGYTLIRQIRAWEKERGKTETPILAIAITAYAGEVERQKALAAGFQSHLSKPISPKTLIDALIR